MTVLIGDVKDVGLAPTEGAVTVFFDGDAVGPKDAVTKAQLDALAARVAALESTAVTSGDYRKIAKGTGTSTDTIYIQE